LDAVQTLGALVALWLLFLGAVKYLKLEREGFEVSPYYAIVKSTVLNKLITRLANVNPRAWRIFGNVAVASAVGQSIFATYLLASNLHAFIFRPEAAGAVQPLIPGVTISTNSLPWFLLAAGVVILTHELMHGVQCVIEGVKVKSAAFLYAVITFGGAVEPDEETLKQATLMGRLRIYASGSLINISLAMLVILLGTALGEATPLPLAIFLNWLFFVSLNLAVMNMLPLGPLDGGQMLRDVTAGLKYGKQIQQLATYSVLILIGGNLLLSMGRFGFIPI
jgi:membrane-associated protease RseP (regulator of RpoE activity)